MRVSHWLSSWGSWYLVGDAMYILLLVPVIGDSFLLMILLLGPVIDSSSCNWPWVILHESSPSGLPTPFLWGFPLFSYLVNILEEFSIVEIILLSVISWIHNNLGLPMVLAERGKSNQEILNGIETAHLRWDSIPQSLADGTWTHNLPAETSRLVSGLTEVPVLVSWCRENSTRGKVIGKKWVFFFFFLAAPVFVAASMWNLVPRPGIKPRPPALGVWSLTHWTTREVPRSGFNSIGLLWRIQAGRQESSAVLRTKGATSS